ncbi:MAG: hypothetical protein ABEH64_00310 [Salinirussus sp.]
MCHEFFVHQSEESVRREDISSEETTPSFLNEEREADVELLTEGGT